MAPERPSSTTPGEWLKHFCEYLGGSRDTPPEGVNVPLTSVFWGLWWGLLLALILVFSGQTSKFIYIDF